MKSIAAIPLFGTFVVLGWLGVASQMSAAADKTTRTPIQHPAFDPTRKDADVLFHEGRVQRDPGGAIGWSMLSGAYLARSRESDSYPDAVKAEQAARKSLALRTMGNLGGQTRLINALLQQHRFADALATDEKALKIWGEEPQLNQLHADILIEVGRYEDAREVLATVPQAFRDPTGQSVLARLSAIEGRPGEALCMLKGAYAVVDANANATDENLAWFQQKIGEALASMGRTQEAQKAFEKTLALYPRSYKAYANLAKLAATRKDWPAVVANGEKSNAIAPMADILALVGDAYAHQGKTQMAEAMYNKVVALAGKPATAANGLHEFTGTSGGHGHTLDRQYAIFCADHGRDLDTAYACAIRDLQARRDVYAFDALAWVCFRKGDLGEARKAMDKALSQGTKDPLLQAHADMIYGAKMAR